MNSEQLENIAREITFYRRFEVRNSAGYTDLCSIQVHPSDVGWDADHPGHDLSITSIREHWRRRCELEGEILVLQRSKCAMALDAIAEKAKRIDWPYAMQQIADAADDDAIMDIQQELLEMRWDTKSAKFGTPLPRCS
jgi:hypothetical protein